MWFCKFGTGSLEALRSEADDRHLRPKDMQTELQKLQEEIQNLPEDPSVGR